MNWYLTRLICMALCLLGLTVSTNAEGLAGFAAKRCLFIWDAGSQMHIPDAGDVFFDWTISCDPHASSVSFDEASDANRQHCSDCRSEQQHIHQVLNAYQLQQVTLSGAIIRARLGDHAGPLFVLAPSVHAVTWIDMVRGRLRSKRSQSLHVSNVLDFLHIIDIAKNNQQSISNVSEMMNLLLGGKFLQYVRQTISEEMPRSDYPSDRLWVKLIFRRGVVDAGSFLSIAFKESDTVTHLPIESRQSYIDSALLSIVLGLRQSKRLAPGQTLYDAFQHEYELGLAYTGHLEHRFSGSVLMERFRKNWQAFKAYSQLTEGPLLALSTFTCQQRSQEMAARLTQLARSKRADFYLVTFGPLHLHGILKGLEHDGFSYLLIAPQIHSDVQEKGM